MDSLCANCISSASGHVAVESVIEPGHHPADEGVAAEEAEVVPNDKHDVDGVEDVRKILLQLSCLLRLVVIFFLVIGGCHAIPAENPVKSCLSRNYNITKLS